MHHKRSFRRKLQAFFLSLLLVLLTVAGVPSAAYTGDRIVIRKATVRTKILKLNHLSFVEVLRQKMSNS